jgi:3-hydroxy acid dehydrogenase / malonic semialdehyde reductase
MTGRGIRPGAVALVTGASSGIGRATARALACEGCRVILTARRADRLAELAGEIGAGAVAIPLDVRDGVGVAGLIDRLPPEARAIDILINNAGHDVGGRRRFDQGAMDDWADIIQTNVQGLLRVTRAVLPDMLARGSGDIVSIGSLSGVRSTPELSAYGASKAAVHMFCENLRSELAGSGVRVIEILPGPTCTEFALERYRGDERKAQAFYAGVGIPLAADDIARAIVFALQQPVHVTVAQLMLVPSTLR